VKAKEFACETAGIRMREVRIWMLLLGAGVVKKWDKNLTRAKLQTIKEPRHLADIRLQRASAEHCCLIH
jgi:hypothetical protein